MLSSRELRDFVRLQEYKLRAKRNGFDLSNPRHTYSSSVRRPFFNRKRKVATGHLDTDEPAASIDLDTVGRGYLSFIQPVERW